MDRDQDRPYQVGGEGDAARLIAAYRRAVRGAPWLRAELIAAGVDPEGLTVTAGVSAQGEPVVHVTVLPVIAVQLAGLLDDEERDGSGGVPSGMPPRAPGDPGVGG